MLIEVVYDRRFRSDQYLNNQIMKLNRTGTNIIFIISLILILATSQDLPSSQQRQERRARDYNQTGQTTGKFMNTERNGKEQGDLRKQLGDIWKIDKSKQPRNVERARLETELQKMRKFLQKNQAVKDQQKQKTLKYQQFVDSPEEAALIGKQNLNKDDTKSLQASTKQEKTRPQTIWTTFKPILISVLVISILLKLIHFIKNYHHNTMAEISQTISEESQRLS